MAYVITDNCIKDELCIQACPVDCIHPSNDEDGWETAAQVYVDPVECIDCGACVPACTSDAIFPLDDVPADKHSSSRRTNVLRVGLPGSFAKNHACDAYRRRRFLVGKLCRQAQRGIDAAKGERASRGASDAVPRRRAPFRKLARGNVSADAQATDATSALGKSLLA